jgi:hypothetical protein
MLHGNATELRVCGSVSKCWPQARNKGQMRFCGGLRLAVLTILRSVELTETVVAAS